MTRKTQVLVLSSFTAFAFLFVVQLSMAQSDSPEASTQNIPPTVVERYHPAVGSWIGIAVQVCQTGVAPAACFNGSPAISLFMTPTLTSDGIFLGNDSLALQGVPFGPHTTAHGKWVPTSQTDFIADYVFMLNTYPPVQDTITGLRFRWLAQVVGNDSIVGYVNAYFVPAVPMGWSKLESDTFPAFPNEALPLVTSPRNFYKNPGECESGQACPLIFKFNIRRVTP